MKAQRMTDSIVYHGEGPCWSDQWGGLRWVDMLAGDILHLAADGTVTRTHVDAVAAAVRPRAGGGAVIAGETGFLLEDPDGTVHPLPPLWSGENIRMNEGGCAPDGSFWAGSMAYDQAQGTASMYRLDPDGTAERMFGGLTVSNGLDFTPDGTRAFYNDTATGRIDVFDWTAERGLHGRRPFVDLNDEDLSPDGLTVDSAGGVWTALNGAGQVRRFDADGAETDRIDVGARQTTACALGGNDLRTLFITTSRENLPDDEDPAAGSLFSATVDVPGKPVLPFTG